MFHIVKLSKIPVRHLSTRPAVLAVCCPRPDYGPVNVQRTTLMNGIKIASAKPLGAPIASCTVMFQAGSRFEVDDQLGATHFLRACSTATGLAYSSCNKMKMLHQNGVSITCATDRQTVSFTMRCPPVKFPELKYYLVDVAARCCFNEWEIEDRKSLVRDDLTRLHPQARVLDLVQTACWTGPLANSIYCPSYRINDMNEESLNCYAFTNYNVGEMTVTSVGLPFDETMRVAELVEYKTVRPKPRSMQMPSCPRAGYEFHDLGPNADTWIAVAVPGCGTCDINCLLKHAVIASACGTHDQTRGTHVMNRSPISPAGDMAGEDVYTRFRAFNISYLETGVFGIVAKTRACTAWSVALAASEFLTKIGDLSFKQIAYGKSKLRVDLAMHDEDCVRVSEGLALQLANGLHFDSARDSIAMIDSLPLDEISCTAKMLSSKSCQMALAVVGDVGAVPHDCELMCNR